MSKMFKNVNSFEDLKKQYKELLKENHPDNGGDVEKMQEINIEYDALFRIWKDRQEKETGETVEETASSTRNEFYTRNGWKGSNYNIDLSLKEIAKIVSTYIKEKSPTYKFSGSVLSISEITPTDYYRNLQIVDEKIRAINTDGKTVAVSKNLTNTSYTTYNTSDL